MKRRDFIISTGALAAGALLPASLTAAPMDYAPGLVQRLLDEGNTVFLDFKADWCTTCAAQERVIGKLTAENPAYEEAVRFVNVDWDEYGRSELAQSLKIPRRSTLVVLKGSNELGRIVAGTGEAEIKALMDTALAAATA